MVAMATAFLFTACAGAPKLAKPQYSKWYYAYTIPLSTKQAETAPCLEMALSLLTVEYPAEQTSFVYDILYLDDNLSAYKDRLIREQRNNFRAKMESVWDFYGEDAAYNNWRYGENIDVVNPLPTSIMIKRAVYTYEGGAHGYQQTRYYMVSLDPYKLVKIDDLFSDFQGDAVRAAIYAELRNYSDLRPRQPLSEGIFFTDEPELTFNFYFTREGLGLHWDAYQIAPYSQGNIDLVIPWDKVRPLMLNSGIELLTKFEIYLFVS